MRESNQWLFLRTPLTRLFEETTIVSKSSRTRSLFRGAYHNFYLLICLAFLLDLFSFVSIANARSSLVLIKRRYNVGRLIGHPMTEIASRIPFLELMTHLMSSQTFDQFSFNGNNFHENEPLFSLSRPLK